MISPPVGRPQADRHLVPHPTSPSGSHHSLHRVNLFIMKFYIVVLSVAALAVSVSSRAVSGRDANPDLISRFDDTIKRDDIIGAVGKRSLIPKDTDCTGCTF